MKPQRKAAVTASRRLAEIPDAERFIERAHMVVLKKDGCISGKGIFSNTFIEDDTPLLIYHGDFINEAEMKKRTEDYLSKEIRAKYFVLRKNKSVLDATMHMNNDTYLAHFINNSCEPNCILKEVDSKIWLITYAPVDKNTEFTIKYDWDWVDGVPPTICTCKSNVCYGIIERNDDNYNNFIRKNPDYIRRENSDRRCIPGGICFCPMMISFGKENQNRPCTAVVKEK